jgi:type IV secretion system protein VirB10
MSVWRRRTREEAPGPETSTLAEGSVADEETSAAPLGRGRPQVQRVRSLEARVGNALALALFAVIAAGLLVWYYARAWSRPHVRVSAQALEAAARAQGEMRLPALSIPLRRAPVGVSRAPAAPPSPHEIRGDVTAARHPATLGPLLRPSRAGWRKGRTAGARNASRPLQRALSGPVFVVETGRPSLSASSPVAPEAGAFVPTAAGGTAPAVAVGTSFAASVSARRLSSLDFLLPEGASLDCTLETAIDSTLPGLATCVMPHDVFGASGRVVLLERGTQLVGHVRSDVRAGQARLYVLWTSARTPNGVVVNLDSQGTDPLGRAGLPGKVERQWRERFGAAVMLSVLQGAIAAAVASQEKPGNSSVVINPTGPADLLTQALQQSAAIPPRIVKAQGDRIAILVERNIDFRSVYRLIHVPAAR